jgi:thiol-disulfide isomerase/thioredoxin
LVAICRKSGYMKKLLNSLAALIISLSANAQHIPACSAQDIVRRCSSTDTLYIINFWATWCPPCVAELPEFNALQRHYAGKPVKILLVSLDFKEDYPLKLERFIERKKLLPPVAWLSDTDPNVFIPVIEKSWEGSIPATVIVHTGRQFKKFIEGSITEQQVAAIADRVLHAENFK